MNIASASGKIITLLHNGKVDEGHKSRFVIVSRKTDARRESLAEVNTTHLLLRLPEGGAVGKLLVHKRDVMNSSCV